MGKKVCILPSRVFPILFEFYAGDKRANLGSLIAYLMSRDEVHAYAFTELWFDAGSIDMYNVIQQAGEVRNCA